MPGSDSEPLPVRVQRNGDGVATITIDRPGRRNALNLSVKNLLADAIVALGEDDEVRVVVITGAGGCFVAGTDIAEMAGMRPNDHAILATDRVFKEQRRCAKIIIAAVEGYALGGGCELALGCDLIVAGAGARFGQPEIRVGIMPGAGGTQRLVRTIGKYRTMKLVLTGETISASDAFAVGMLSEIVPDGAALERALALGRTIAAMPALAVAAIKDVVQLGADAPLDAALALERKAFVGLFDTQDQKEGMRAFLDKRTPSFTGR